MSNPNKSHLLATKRIRRYIKGTLKHRVLFPNKNQLQVDLLGYSYSYRCRGKSDRRSITGYLFKFLGAPISWCSKKQLVVALSSFEVEYIAGSYAACQAIWLDSILKEMSVNVEKPMQLLIDNKSTINLLINLVSHGTSKHI